MPLFNYTPTKDMAQVTPVNFTTQPNLSFSRAIANLQEAAVAGAQLKDQLDKTKYDKALIEFEQKKGVFNTRWEESDFDTRLNVLLPELQDQFVLPYADSKNKYSRDLYLKATTLANGYFSATAKEGIEDRYRDNEVALIDNLLSFDQEWKDNPDINYHADMVAKYDEQFVDPYRDQSDPYSQALLKKALGVKEQYLKTISGERTAKKDNVLSSEIIDIIGKNIALTGDMPEDLWTDIVKKAKGISDFGIKEGAYLRTYADNTMTAMKSYVSNLSNDSTTTTWDNYLTAKEKVANFAKMQPQIQGTDSYRELLNVVDSLKNTINNQDLIDLNAEIGNDGTSLQTVTEKAQALVDRGFLSEDRFERAKFDKRNALEVRKIGPDILNAFINEDLEKLAGFATGGKAAQVSEIVSTNLENQLRLSLQNGGDLMTSLDSYFVSRDKYKDLPFRLQSSEFIDDILKSARNGTMEDESSMATFAAVYKKAVKENKYMPTGANANYLFADYMTIQGLMNLGVPNMLDVFQTTRTGPRPKAADVAAVYDTLSRDEEWFTMDLNPAVNDKLRTFFEPAIESLLKYNLDTTAIAAELTDVIDSNFIRTEAFGGTVGKQILIPAGTNNGRITSITNAKDYQNVVRSLNYQMKDGTDKDSWYNLPQRETFVMPQDFNNPNGNWVVFYDNGQEARVLTPKEIDVLVKSGLGAPYTELDPRRGK